MFERSTWIIFMTGLLLVILVTIGWLYGEEAEERKLIKDCERALANAADYLGVETIGVVNAYKMCKGKYDADIINAEVYRRAGVEADRCRITYNGEIRDCDMSLWTLIEYEDDQKLAVVRQIIYGTI